jgi:hypothetical protein
MHSFLIDSNKKFIATPLRGVPVTQRTTACAPLATLALRWCLTHLAPVCVRLRARSFETSAPTPPPNLTQNAKEAAALQQGLLCLNINSSRVTGSRASPQKAEPKVVGAIDRRVAGAIRRATAPRMVVPTAAAKNTAGARTRTHRIGDC